jgi:ribosomal protein S18 acetylase RimI-like enzyme
MVFTPSGVDLSVQQFIGAWRVMCSGSPGYVRSTVDGVDYVFSGIPIPFFNVAILSESALSAATLAQKAQQACAWAADKEVPWLFVLTHEALEPGVDATAIADAAGLAPLMPMTGMIAHTITPGRPVPADLEVTTPADDDGCGAIIDVNAVAYGMDLEAGKTILARRAFWDDHFLTIGWSGGKAVAGTAVLMVDGYRYVAMVATDPAHQRRGYGDAVMRRALELSAVQYGDRPTVLHATDAGRPVYERMGYTPISTHTVFLEKRFLTAPH